MTDDRRVEDEAWLRGRYHGDGLSTTEIGEMVGLSAGAISYWLDKHGIDTRDQITDPRLRDAEWVRARYHRDGLSLPDIGEMTGVAPSVVSYWLDRHGIESDWASPTCPFCGRSKTDDGWRSRSLADHIVRHCPEAGAGDDATKSPAADRRDTLDAKARGGER